jgi:hypothetical protein
VALALVQARDPGQVLVVEQLDAPQSSPRPPRRRGEQLLLPAGILNPALDLTSLIVDRRQSSLDPATDKTLEVAPFTLTAGESLKLHIYIDHSVVEVFAGSHICLTSRIYPTRADSCGVRPVAVDGRVRLQSFDIWTMKAIEIHRRNETT